MKPPLGVQIAPWTPARTVYETAPLLARAFDMVWVPDQLLARNAQVLLAALAAGGRIGVASGIAVPLGRNPVDLASGMATIAELLPPDRPMVVGMGAGGSLVSGLFTKAGATDLLRECVALFRRLWSGEAVSIADYPNVARQVRWRDGATARLTYPVRRPLPIFAAVGGPRTMELVEEVADGLICTTTYPALSYAALGQGRLPAGIAAVAQARASAGRPLRMVYGLNICVSADRSAARAATRRQVALIVGNPALRSELAAAGLDDESLTAVRRAFAEGAGVVDAARQVSDDLIDAFVVSGTPDECVERLGHIVPAARAAGFGEFYLGAPLGPDLPEAAELLVNAVVPEIWSTTHSRGTTEATCAA
ncbi:LLM class flavin-dependent oxidoreductase [Actinoplanes sp. NPDC051346]|uniref:LLM class flavin-dependent oxidoreductase n=1 Tax=Actinoplanes sp. NPDC051346 TaxID=3155048 RepID=UPI003447B607